MTRYRQDSQNKIKITDDRDVIYIISKKHRDHTPQKSRWTISMSKEVTLFKAALESGYEDKIKCVAWNILIVDGAVCVIGQSVDGVELKIAKFVDSNKNEQWHGYPANYIKNIQDIPPYVVLLTWKEAGYISTATMKKIKGGQPCNL